MLWTRDKPRICALTPEKVPTQPDLPEGRPLKRLTRTIIARKHQMTAKKDDIFISRSAHMHSLNAVPFHANSITARPLAPSPHANCHRSSSPRVHGDSYHVPSFSCLGPDIGAAAAPGSRLLHWTPSALPPAALSRLAELSSVQVPAIAAAALVVASWYLPYGLKALAELLVSFLIAACVLILILCSCISTQDSRTTRRP